jgi:hypothetical protein
MESGSTESGTNSAPFPPGLTSFPQQEMVGHSFNNGPGGLSNLVALAFGLEHAVSSSSNGLLGPGYDKIECVAEQYVLGTAGDRCWTAATHTSPVALAGTNDRLASGSHGHGHLECPRPWPRLNIYANLYIHMTSHLLLVLTRWTPASHIAR